VSFTDPLIIRGFVRGITDPTLRTLVCTGPGQNPWHNLSDLQAHAAIVAASARPNAPSSISPRAPRPHAGKVAKLAAKRSFGDTAGGGAKKDSGKQWKGKQGSQTIRARVVGVMVLEGQGVHMGPLPKSTRNRMLRVSLLLVHLMTMISV
jgi:hypothetical protein